MPFSVLDSSKLKMWFIARPSNKKFPPYITTLTLSSIIFWYFSSTNNTKVYFWKIGTCMFIFTWMCLCEYMHKCLLISEMHTYACPWRPREGTESSSQSVSLFPLEAGYIPGPGTLVYSARLETSCLSISPISFLGFSL